MENYSYIWLNDFENLNKINSASTNNNGNQKEKKNRGHPKEREENRKDSISDRVSNRHSIGYKDTDRNDITNKLSTNE